MEFSEIGRKIIINELWSMMNNEFQLHEILDSKLSNLLNIANKTVFEKFNIDPKNKVYFIAGSARLHLYPDLKNAFDFKEDVGDLDVIIPNKKYWVEAGLEKEYNEGFYRPFNDNSIEVFHTWDPSKAGGSYSNVNVRNTNDILRDSNFIDGYYFMNMLDVIDYKVKLNRDKEKQIVDIVHRFIRGDFKDRSSFLRKMTNAIGINKTKDIFKK
jgi:hypothetical protein